MDRAAASALRQRLHKLREERERLEAELLELRAVLRGSLVTSQHLSGGQARSRPAFYLCRRESGRQRLHYVRRAELEAVRRDVGAYRRYREALGRLRVLSREVLVAFKALLESLDLREAP